MNEKRQQKFDYRNSPYARPNAEWECGRLQEGKPCAMGPDRKGNCQTRTECLPIKNDDRWSCARSPLEGGACEQGPNPDGSCCRTVTRCSPTRTWRAKRVFLSKWAAATFIGIAVLMLSGSDMAQFVSPGKLSTKHADFGECQTCHSPFEQGLAHWVKTAFVLDSGVDDSSLCLSCHVIKENPQLPHNLSLAKLDELTGTAATVSQSSLLPQLQLASWLYPERHQQREELTCATCHREHHGDNSDLTKLSNQQCLICHQAKFDNFAKGHPEFTDFPYERRTKLNFDHVSHLNKHFKEKEHQSIADGSCTQCHEPDAKGNKMLVKSFDTSCSSCHTKQILGETRSGSKGIPVFAVPGLDVQTLKEKGVLIGDWPEFADAALSPFMELLLSSDKKFVTAQAALKRLDLLELEDMNEKELQYVAELAWSVKGLLHGLLQNGTAELKTRLTAPGEQTLENMEVRSLVSMLPEDAVRLAQQNWFPRLFEEIQYYQNGELAKLKTLQETPLVNTSIKEQPRPAPIVDEDEDDALFADNESDDDLFGEDDDEDLFGDDDEGDLFGEEEEPDSSNKVVQLSAEDWAAFGGWFRDEFALRYAPTGHADSFLKSWLDYLSTNNSPAKSRVLKSLVNANAVGACNKCHSVDVDLRQGTTINWRAIGADKHELEFTKYSHTTHFNLTDDRGCVQCHIMDKEADYAASFEHNDPHNFTSNFKPMDRQFCASCHQKQSAGDSCLQCHNYHITDILSDLMANGQ